MILFFIGEYLSNFASVFNFSLEVFLVLMLWYSNI